MSGPKVTTLSTGERITFGAISTPLFPNDEDVAAPPSRFLNSTQLAAIKRKADDEAADADGGERWPSGALREREIPKGSEQPPPPVKPLTKQQLAIAKQYGLTPAEYRAALDFHEGRKP